MPNRATAEKNTATGIAPAPIAAAGNPHVVGGDAAKLAEAQAAARAAVQARIGFWDGDENRAEVKIGAAGRRPHSAR